MACNVAKGKISLYHSVWFATKSLHPSLEFCASSLLSQFAKGWALLIVICGVCYCLARLCGPTVLYIAVKSMPTRSISHALLRILKWLKFLHLDIHPSGACHCWVGNHTTWEVHVCSSIWNLKEFMNMCLRECRASRSWNSLWMLFECN